jgi:hypothetical protein
MQAMKLRMNLLCMVVLSAMPAALFAQEEIKLEYHAAGWAQLGKIESSYIGSDSGNDYQNNWMQNAGGQISVTAKIDSNWEGGLALGVVGVHLPRGGSTKADFWYPFWVPYVGEARITYSHSVGTGKFQLTMGNFGYGYSGDAKNLGLYLLRGYVYPGALESGFGSIFGAMARYRQAGFRNDVILKSEDERPVYDWSLADVISYQIRPGLEIGAGVNFYRLIPHDDNLTTPGATCQSSYGQCSIIDYSDTAGEKAPDTVKGSLAGTKAMARFSLDPKLLFGLGGAFGKQDLILYGEAAIIGFKDYAVVYDDIFRRIPVMAGFNFPAFGYLDYLSLEVEYYASKNSSDNAYANFGGAWVPRQDDDSVYARDDWKWSVNLAKTLFGHMQFSAQVANDHLRPGGWHNAPNTGKEAFRTPEDWYWTCKLAYFF